MTGARRVVVEMTAIETAHLSALTRQFAELLDDASAASPADPAIRRLVPDAYPGDAEASGEFRRLTSGDLLGRRSADAQTVLATLAASGPVAPPDEIDDSGALDPRVIELDRAQADAWLRTLTAVRLVLASRLGIEDEETRPVSDPRFLLYDWLGQRLEVLVQALGR